MKHLLLLIFAIFSIVSLQAQDEFYSEEPSKQPETELLNSKSDTLEEYYTEQDYVMNDEQEGNEDKLEIYDNDKEEERKKRRRRENAEFVAEIVFDVVIQTAFFVATFWLQ